MKKFKVATKSEVYDVYANRFVITPSGVAVFKDYRDNDIEAVADFYRIVFIEDVTI